MIRQFSLQKAKWLRAALVVVVFAAILTGVAVPEAGAVDLVERVLALPFNLVAGFLEKVLGMYSPDVWIYAGLIEVRDEDGNIVREIPEGVFSPKAEIGGVLTRTEWEGIVWPWFQAFQLVAWVLMGITIVYTGLKIAASKDSARSRAEVEGWITSILIAIVVIAFTPYFVEVMFDLNLAIVKACARAVAGNDFAFMHGNLFAALEAEGTVEQGSLAYAIVTMVWVGMSLYFCIRYLLRKLMIMFLIILAPLAGWAATWQRNKTTLFLVLGELVSNIFVQSAHALALTLILAIWGAASVGPGAGWIAKQEWWIKPTMLSLLIPISGLVSRMINTWLEIIGVNEDQYVSGAMRQLGGIAGVAAVVGSFFVPSGAVSRLGKLGFGGGGSGGGGGGPTSDWTLSPPGGGGGAAIPSGGGAPAGGGVPSFSLPAKGAPPSGMGGGAAGGMLAATGAAGAGAAAAGRAASAARGIASAAGSTASTAASPGSPLASGSGAVVAAGGAGTPAGGGVAGSGGATGASAKGSAAGAASSGGEAPGGPGFGPAAKPGLKQRVARWTGDKAANLPGQLAYGAVKGFGYAVTMAATQRNPATGEVMVDASPAINRAADPLARYAGHYADRGVERLTSRVGRPVKTEERWGFDDHSWAREA